VEAYSASPDSLAIVRVPSSRGRGKGGRGGKGEKKGRGREREGPPPLANSWIRPKV